MAARATVANAGRSLEVFGRFLLLGMTSFGGPTAHLGYFHTTFVERLRWIEERGFSATVALCQFLPGPGSSQVGFAIGVHRAGLLGGLAAFVGFTTPSFLLMYGLASLDASVTDAAWFAGSVASLKLLAVAVVAHAVIGMAQQFWRGAGTVMIGVLTSVIMFVAPGLLSQVIVLIVAALAGALLLRGSPGDAGDVASAGETATETAIADHATPSAAPGRDRLWPLLAFAAILMVLPLVAFADPLLELFSDLARVGSLVFGGGHVVLPLLQASLDGVGEDQFLIGYAAAQGVPGPMFTLGTYLGAVAYQPAPLAGALVATLGIFAPGFLLVCGLQGRWLQLANRSVLAGAFAALDAAVVGLLLAAFVNPVWSSSVTSLADGLTALAGYVALRKFKIGVVWLVLAALVLGVARGLS